MDKYEDSLLESLRQVYEKNPDDNNFKKCINIMLNNMKKKEDTFIWNTLRMSCLQLSN